MGSDIGTGVSKPVYVMGGGGQGIESLTSTSLVFKTRDYPKATHRILGIFGWLGEKLAALSVGLCRPGPVAASLFAQNIRWYSVCWLGFSGYTAR